jgi:hypothetical protein
MNQTLFIFATIYPTTENFLKAKSILENIIENTKKEINVVKIKNKK